MAQGPKKSGRVSHSKRAMKSTTDAAKEGRIKDSPERVGAAFRGHKPGSAELPYRLPATKAGTPRPSQSIREANWTDQDAGRLAKLETKLQQKNIQSLERSELAFLRKRKP